MLKTHTKKITAFMSVAAILFSMLLYFPDGTFSTCFGLKASAAEIELTEPSKFGGAYQIGTAGELYWFAEYVNRGSIYANAVLTANITVNQNVLNENGEVNSGDFTSWTPIGVGPHRYEGTFDGQNHTVSGLYSRSGGLFGDVDRDGNVSNVGVIDSYLGGYDLVGGVCGVNNGEITNCYMIGEVSGNEGVGGVCGVNNGVVTNCYNTGAVSGIGNYIGGVCGENNDTIINCYNTGAVSGIGNYIGGVCGHGFATIENCYYLKGSAKGGIEGSDYHDLAESKTTTEFKSGEVAYLLSQGTNGSVWGQAIGTEDYPVLGGAAVYQVIVYTGCKINPGDSSTGFSNTNSPVYAEHSYDENGFCKDCGVYQPAEIISDETSQYNGYYAIENASQLYWFVDKVNIGNTSISAVLTADITVNTGDVAGCNGTKAEDWIDWTPIGNSSNKYTGTFDGQNHTISGLYFNNPDEEYAGLFGSVESGGKISCVGIADSYFRGNDYIGGICGENVGIITNCYNSGTVISVNRKAVAGGICGYNEGTITNCYNSGNISAEGKASFVGGVCGLNEDGTITNCYYLAETADENGGKTEAQFASGEAAYLLSQGTDGSVWGQTIGTDPMPVMGGKKVLGNIDKSAFANDIIIYGQNAALDGTIGFNIYVSADDSYEWDKTIGGVTGVKNEEGLYVFAYNVAAKDMDNEIQFTVNDKIDVTVSVSEYIAELSENDNAELKDLADSMSAYGDAAQNYFGGENVAEQTVTDDLSIYDFIVGTMPEGIRYYGSSLILESGTTIRHYFTLAEGKNIADFTFKVNNSAVTPTEKQGYYCIDIQNISAEKLETAFTVSINGKKIITNYSALSYAKKVLDSDKTDANLKNLVKALYIYNQNALAYINAA